MPSQKFEYHGSHVCVFVFYERPTKQQQKEKIII